VPDESTGDQVMVAFEWNKDAPAFDAVAFCAFLGQQSDLGTKWAPRYVRITEHLPVTATSKVLKRSLRSERWNVSDPIWIRDRSGNYRLLDEPKREELNSAVGKRVL
ncbi:MAG: acyl-CoA synthetase, partial [Actinobacteria bacterium]|nr:acyl-CoA synthetase [Actinomycetota bacterium]